MISTKGGGMTMDLGTMSDGWGELIRVWSWGRISADVRRDEIFDTEKKSWVIFKNTFDNYINFTMDNIKFF